MLRQYAKGFSQSFSIKFVGIVAASLEKNVCKISRLLVENRLRNQRKLFTTVILILGIDIRPLI